MTDRRPAVTRGVAKETGGSQPQQPEAGRQGDLWDEPSCGAPASRDDSAEAGRPALESAEAPAQDTEARPQERGRERSDEAGEGFPVSDELLPVARHLVALLEEGGRPARPERATEPEEKPGTAEEPGGDGGESPARPEEPARSEEPADRPATEAGEVAAAPESEAPGQEDAGAVDAMQVLRTFQADFGRRVEGERRSRRRWTGIAMAAGLPAALMLGVLLQQQLQIVALHDPTKGWGGHIWEMYGRTIVSCALEAMRTDAEVNCPLVVRRP